MMVQYFSLFQEIMTKNIHIGVVGLWILLISDNSILVLKLFSLDKNISLFDILVFTHFKRSIYWAVYLYFFTFKNP